MFSLQHLFLMLPGSNFCPGEGDWPDPCCRKGFAGPSLTHRRLNSKQEENMFIIASLDQDLFPEGLWSRKLWSHLCICACMSVPMSKDNRPQRSKRAATLKNNKALSSTSRKRQKQMIRESEKARDRDKEKKPRGR